MVLCRRTACAVTRAGHVPARQRQNDPGGGASRSTGAVHILSDVVRKELAHLAPGEPRSEAFGKGLYAPTMTRRPYAALIRRASHCLRRGHSVVLDATFGSPDERATARRLTARTRAQLVIFVCRVDEHVLIQRLRGCKETTSGFD